MQGVCLEIDLGFSGILRAVNSSLACWSPAGWGPKDYARLSEPHKCLMKRSGLVRALEARLIELVKFAITRGLGKLENVVKQNAKATSKEQDLLFCASYASPSPASSKSLMEFIIEESKI